jgi:hypothetical protein
MNPGLFYHIDSAAGRKEYTPHECHDNEKDTCYGGINFTFDFA